LTQNISYGFSKLFISFGFYIFIKTSLLVSDQKLQLRHIY